MRYSKRQFDAEYPDDDACLESVFKNRFGHLKFCPHCGAETTFYRVKKRQCYACQWCSYQLFPLANTIFRSTNIPLKDWFYAIYLVSVSKNGVSAKELERHLGVSYKTAWRMMKQIRLLMEQDRQRLKGTVEIDETYVGGRRKKAPGRTTVNKSPVVGLVERKGQVRAEVTQSVTNMTMFHLLRKHTEEGTKIHTDEFRAYSPLKRMGFDHSAISHSKKVWVKGDVHTNTIEGFWSQMKRSIDGTYHCVSRKYLQSYVNEFAFRYNHRNELIFPLLMAKAAKRV